MKIISTRGLNRKSESVFREICFHLMQRNSGGADACGSHGWGTSLIHAGPRGQRPPADRWGRMEMGPTRLLSFSSSSLRPDGNRGGRQGGDRRRGGQLQPSQAQARAPAGSGWSAAPTQTRKGRRGGPGATELTATGRWQRAAAVLGA